MGLEPYEGPRLARWYTGPRPWKPLSSLRSNGHFGIDTLLIDPRLRPWVKAQRKALKAGYQSWLKSLKPEELEALGKEGTSLKAFLHMQIAKNRVVAADGTVSLAAKAERFAVVKNPMRFGKFAGHMGENFLYDVAFGAFDTAMETSRTAREFGAKYNDPTAVFIGGTLGFRRARNRNVVAVIGGSIGTALGFALGGHPIIGNIVGSTIGGKIGEIWDPGLNAQANLELQISRTANVARRVNFGGDFEDTQQAYTMRQQAVQEMSGSLMNARQYLGNEAAFFHGI